MAVEGDLAISCITLQIARMSNDDGLFEFVYLLEEHNYAQTDTDDTFSLTKLQNSGIQTIHYNNSYHNPNTCKTAFKKQLLPSLRKPTRFIGSEED